MGFIQRAKSLLGFEGSARGPYSGMGELGGFYPIEATGDGWQRNLEIGYSSARQIPTVFACVQAKARAVASCYPLHKQSRPDGGEDVIKTSPAYRFFRRPNSYQTWPQFIQNVVSAMLFDGEAFCQIVRDNRTVVTAMHLLPRGSCSPFVAEDGSIFYNVGQNPMNPAQTSYAAPQREICHFRTFTPRHPLIGESPVKAALLACGINVALSKTQAQFFSQMNRPSGILSTEQVLTKEQMVRLREAFNEQSKGWATGQMPILGGGLKFDQMSVNSQDAQLIEAQRMSIEEIARVYGVPLPIIGDLSHATLNNTESLINHWLAISLGALLENLERSFDEALGLQDNDFTEFDTRALLRLDFAGRIEALTKGTQGALFTPNEARRMEGMPEVEGGDQPFMQAQNVPVNLLSELAAAQIAAKKQPPAAPAAPPPAAKELDVTVAKALAANMLASKKAHAHG